MVKRNILFEENNDLITPVIEEKNTKRHNIHSSQEIIWKNNGIAICDADDYQEWPQICSDGLGGTIIVWEDERGYNSDIYAQRIDANGTPLWMDNGVVICDEQGDQGWPYICSDGLGGAFIVWDDKRGSDKDIYAQRIDANGTPLWMDNGVVICDEHGDQEFPQICENTAGNAIIIWGDLRDGPTNDDDIYAQKLNSSGHIKWEENGIAICNKEGEQISEQICSCNDEGVIIVWEDYRSCSNYDIYAQKIDSNGNNLWTDNGTVICNEKETQSEPQINCDNSGNSIIVWDDWRSGHGDIYAQKIDNNGNNLWTDNGTVICDAQEYQWETYLCSDGSGGAIITWVDYRNLPYDIYVQRIDTNGKVLWSDNGILISYEENCQHFPQICSDGSGGAIIVWEEEKSGSDYDIYAQRVNAEGIALWRNNGIVICNAVDLQWFPVIYNDGFQSAIIVWDDWRGDCSDIYAQKISLRHINIERGFEKAFKQAFRVSLIWAIKMELTDRIKQNEESY